MWREIWGDSSLVKEQETPGRLTKKLYLQAVGGGWPLKFGLGCEKGPAFSQGVFEGHVQCWGDVVLKIGECLLFPPARIVG